MKTLTKHLLWAVTTTLCLTVNPATAQEMADTPAPQANDKSVENPGAEGAGETRKLIEEIIVSAERRDANLQDVPVAVSVFSSETRQIIGLDTLTDFAKHTPGLSYSSSDDRVFVRGIGRQTNTAGSEPGVASYGDGAYDSSTVSINGSDFFVERVEVLRGPQGTLYGRNSIGGAINAISKRPKEDVSLDARLAYADYNAWSLSFIYNQPINDAIRASFGASIGLQDEGYFKNVATGNTEGSAVEGALAELQVEIDLTDNISTWFRVFTGQADLKPRATNVIDPYDTAAFPSGYLTPGSALGYSQPSLVQLGSTKENPGVADPFRINVNTESTADIGDYYAIINHTVWKQDTFDIKLIASRRSYIYNSMKDLDGTDVVSYNYPLLGDPSLPCDAPGACVQVFPNFTFGYLEDRDYASVEVDFTSTGDGPLQWIAGLYYYWERMNQGVHFTTPDQPEMKVPVYFVDQNDPGSIAASGVGLLGLPDFGLGDVMPLGPAPANPSGDVVTVDTHLKIQSYAMFGQLDYEFTDKLKATLGLRYTIDIKEADENLRVVCFGCGEPVLIQPGVPALDVTAIAVSYDKADGVDSGVTFKANGLANRRLKNDWAEGTGTLGLQWTPNDDWMTYAKISRGYKAGGFNAGGLTPLPQTDPEYIVAYEVGSKFGYDGTFIFNSSLFYNDYAGLQIPLTVPQASGINLTEFANIDSAYAYGLEVEATWQINNSLQIRTSYAYSDSEITSCCYVDTADPAALDKDAQPVPTQGDGTVIAQSLDGNELNQLPRHKFSLNVNHSTIFKSGVFIASGNLTWQDDMYASIFSRDYYRLDSYFQFDLRGIWTTHDQRYRVILTAKNLLDEDGHDQATALGYITRPASGAQYMRDFGIVYPRRIALTVEMNF
ncbi:MAG: TonB-dependent receptor [Alphaproteobacteria bacterium]